MVIIDNSSVLGATDNFYVTGPTNILIYSDDDFLIDIEIDINGNFYRYDTIIASNRYYQKDFGNALLRLNVKRATSNINAIVYTTEGKADLNKGAQLDAANRARVSQVTTLGDYKQINDNLPLFFSEEIIGAASGTYDGNEGGVVCAVTSNGDAIIRQTKQWHNYFSGKSQVFEVTSSDFHPQTGVTKRKGYFSSNAVSPFNSNLDGIFIETANGGEHTFNVYKNGTEVLSVAQSDWNVDTLGAGKLNPSGIKISGNDWQRFNVFAADFLYLGGTAVAFGFFSKRLFNVCHIYDHAMVNDTVQAPMIKSPNQPLRWEIRSTGSAGTMNQICGAVGSEGSINDIGITRGFNQAATVNYGTSIYALIGVRLKEAYKNITVIPLSGSVLATSTARDYIWTLRVNPTIAGTFTYNDETNSAVQYALGDATNTVTDGTILEAGLGTSDTPIEISPDVSLKIGSQLDNTMDELVLCIQPLTNNTQCIGALNIKEYI